MTVAPSGIGTAFRLRRLDLASIDTETADTIRRLVRRGAVPDPAIREGAAAIVDAVRMRGEAAVTDANARYGQ